MTFSWCIMCIIQAAITWIALIWSNWSSAEFTINKLNNSPLVLCLSKKSKMQEIKNHLKTTKVLSIKLA